MRRRTPSLTSDKRVDVKPASLRPGKSIGLQARDAVVEMISQLQLKAGDKLPSEAELTQAFDISRPMLREALRLLEQDGVLRTEHGRGRFLSAAGSLHVMRPITAYESITVMLRELGYEPETTVLSLRECPASEDEAAATALGCAPNDRVVLIERLRSQDGQPLVYSLEAVPREYLPPDLEPSNLAGSLNELLKRQQRQPRMSSASVSATWLPKGIARSLDFSPSMPWLLITETCLTEEGASAVHARDYHRGDLFSFNFSRR
jgi:GntR family transcriptional regulator